jgi:hypothetical protein
MLLDSLMHLVRGDEGMEMREWSIVGVVFALAGALVWSAMKNNINTALTSIGDCVKNSASC